MEPSPQSTPNRTTPLNYAVTILGGMGDGRAVDERTTVYLLT